MNKQLAFVFACIIAMAAAAATTEDPTKPDQQTREAAKAFWAELTPKQQDCLKEKWQKNKEELKTALKNCRDKKSGTICVKEISQIKACFA